MSFIRDLTATTQGRLADLNYYKGIIDGVEGPMTENAMSRFKGLHGFRERPYPGPLTLATLWSDEAKAAPAPVARGREPAWLSEARSLLGTRETPGSASNPEIMKWARDLDQWYPGDDVPWCGLFVAHCMAAGAPNESQDFNRLGARNWLGFGEDQGPMLGSVCVLWRTHETRSWNGHVFIATGISNGAVRGIGGNQSDNVTETWFSLDRVLGYRVPQGFQGVPLPRATPGQLSTNEA